MASQVQISSGDSGYKASATPVLNSVVAGNALYCCITGWVGTTPATSVSFSDDKGNTWAQAVFVSSNSRFAAIGYCQNVTTGGTVTVTATPTGGTGTVFVASFLLEYSGMMTSGSLDKTASFSYNGGATTTLDTTATSTTAQTDELLLACLGGSGSTDPTTLTNANTSPCNPASGWVNDASLTVATDATCYVVSQMVTSTVAARSVVTVSNGITQYGAVLATFKISGESVTVTWVGYIG